MKFEIIKDEDKVTFARRGRKSNVDQEMVDGLRSLPVGACALVRELQQDPASESYKADKARISASIRAAAKVAGVNVSINWSTDGAPAVTVTAAAAPVRKSK